MNTKMFFLVLSISLILLGCGKDGAMGPQGIPGITPVIQTLGASQANCPNGGTDLYINGAFAASICDGKDGSVLPDNVCLNDHILIVTPQGVKCKQSE